MTSFSSIVRYIVRFRKTRDAFEKFREYSGLRQSYTDTFKRDIVQDWRNDVYQTLVDVGSSNSLIFDTRSFIRWVCNDKTNR